MSQNHSRTLGPLDELVRMALAMPQPSPAMVKALMVASDLAATHFPNAVSESAQLTANFVKLPSLQNKEPLVKQAQISTPADLGMMVREARTARNLTQQQFADLAGVGRRFLSECEKGKPRLEFGKVLQVAAAAGIDLVAKRR